MSRQRAWDVLGTVLDPEVPALSVRDLGIVRDVVQHGDALEVVLTPTYSGCPATEAIERGVIDALEGAGLGPVRVTLRRAPAWTTDWISDEGKRKGQVQEENWHLAYEELLVAEGSDWMWWFGNDFSSDDDAIFDALFRQHIGNIFHFIGLPEPEGLNEPIKKSLGGRKTAMAPPPP